jgi:hypothetical protein
MDILTKLTTAGSTLSKYDGANIPTNTLATKLSDLHADPTGVPGYSLNGGFISVVNPQYASYDDGAVNILPRPSQLDLNGAQPVSYPQTGPVGGHY